MTDPRKHDDPLAGLMARALTAGALPAGVECPDAEILAACFDHSLPTDESARWELHFSRCGRCQEQLAALARMEVAARPSEQPQSQGLSWLWNWRWLAPAAAALGVLAIWVVLRPTGNVTPITSQPVGTIAENRQPAPKLGDETSARLDRPSESPAKKQDAAATTQFGRLEKGARSADLDAQPTSPAQTKPLLADSVSKARDQTVLAPAPVAEPAQDTQQRIAANKDSNAEMQFAVKTKEEVAQSGAKREAQSGALSGGLVAGQEGKLAQRPVVGRTESAELDQKAREAEATKKSQVAAAAPAAEGGRAKDEAGAFSRFRANEIAPRFVSVSVTGTRVLWRVGPGGSIERSDDAGGAWQRQVSGSSADLLAGSAPSATVCWVAGRGGVILRTTDGVTWAQIGSPASADLISIEARDADQASVTTADGKRYATSDGGRTWRSL